MPDRDAPPPARRRHPLGLRPDGIGTTMLPIGLLLSLGIVCAAIAVRRLSQLPWPPGAVVAAAIAFLGIARSIASIWLPKVGSSLTRQHRTSIAVAIIAALACSVQVVRARRDVVEVADR